jgi:hypothetical protein
VKKNDELDIAILAINGAQLPKYTEMQPHAFQSKLQRGEAVKLFGYPGYLPPTFRYARDEPIP